MLRESVHSLLGMDTLNNRFSLQVYFNVASVLTSYLVLVETRPVHRNYNVLKLYHHKLWLILFYFPTNLTSKLLFGILKVCCELSVVYMPVLFWVTFVIATGKYWPQYIDQHILLSKQVSQSYSIWPEQISGNISGTKGHLI